MGYQVLSVLALPAFWVWFAVALGLNTAMTILGLIFAAVVGWMLPDVAVRRRADMRIYQIDYDMPELIDLLVVTVEAGLGFNASLQLASERIEGPARRGAADRAPGAAHGPLAARLAREHARAGARRPRFDRSCAR